MKCPHCDYQNGWSGESMSSVEGDEGDFYRLPVKMERTRYYSYDSSKQVASMFGCPSCTKTFIEKD